MIMADVIGAVVTSSEGTTWSQEPVFLLVDEVSSAGKTKGSPFVALDLIGANRGERVLIAQGSSCRQNPRTKDKPVDAVIAGIIDIVTKNDTVVYQNH